MNKIKLLFNLFLIAFCFVARAQQYNFKNYSVKDGVAQSQIYSLLQDSRGYLWLGTRGGGITRFDGVNFKTFTVKDGLINNYVFCVKEDDRKNLWIGTNSGLSHYNGIEFISYKPDEKTGQLWVQEIAFDKKGRKWLATNNGVYFLYGNKFTNVSALLKDKLSVITSICVDKNGLIWYGNSTGLSVITEYNGKFTQEKMSKTKKFLTNAVTSIRQSNDGSLWVGTYGDGLYVYNGKRFYRIDEHLELYKQTVLDIYFDNRNNAWLATLSNGVCQYNLLAKSFAWLGENEGLSNNHVRSIIQDKSGNYWFGTSGGGVCNYFGKQFTTYDKNSGLGGNFIYSIFKDSKQRLWVGTSDKGLSVLDSGKFYNYNASNGFVDVKVKAIAEDLKGNVYFGTDGQGLFVYDGTTFKLIDEFAKKYIRAIVRDKEGNVYVATAGSGLYKINLESNKIENFTTSDGLWHNRLTCLLYDKQGRLWYGTENNGLGLIINDEATELNITVKDGLPSNSIRCLTEDKNGYLWLGTGGNGIASIPLYQGDYKVSAYDYKDGLTSSNIYLLACDDFNNLFVGTETGLDYLTLNKARKISGIKHYSKGEGFTGIETCQNSVLNDKDGSIWFGTINGLSKYNPANKFKNQFEPVTTVTDVRLFYEKLPYAKNKRVVGDWNVIQGLFLPYDQNHLTFDFLGINFSNPDAVNYQWKLEGFDGDWSPVSQQRTVTYSNIGPGSYTFMVKACNEDGVWNKKPVTVSFTIIPPFWKRPWVIVLFVIIAISLIVAIFRWRVNSIRKKAEQEQRKIQLEKEVLELEQKALRLQMNPHFIFNALNSIQSQIGTDNEQSARYYLAKFSRLMRQILDNSRNTRITLQEEISTLENYLLIEKFCNGDRFDYVIEVDEKIESDYVTTPPMLLQPFIENAIKHGLKFSNDIRGLITISVKEHKGILECAVIDNGIGRKKAEEFNQHSKETYHKSTALIVTQERLDLLKMDKSIVPLEIIDLYDEQNNACGTKVIIRIPIE